MSKMAEQAAPSKTQRESQTHTRQREILKAAREKSDLCKRNPQ